MEVLTAFFDSLSLDNLLSCELLLKEKIKIRKDEHRLKVKSAVIADYVVTNDCLLKEGDDLFDGVTAETLDLGLKADAGKYANIWLTLDNEPYSWKNSQGKDVVNKPHDLNQQPKIKQLMETVNDNHDCDLNSCLVSFYPDGQSGIGYHMDDEAELDPDSPICVFSFGAERTVDFIHAFQQKYEKPALTYQTKSGSLYVMKPGCQSLFRHRVRSISNKERKQVGWRYSLSFRRKIPKPPPLQLTSPLKSLITEFNKHDPASVLSAQPVKFVKPGPSSEPSQPPLKTTYRRKMTTLLLGTSQTTSINSSKCGKRGNIMVNLSKSGAKIADMYDMVDEFHGSNPAADDVAKVILSVGPNDIKYDYHGYKGKLLSEEHRRQKCKSGVVKYRQKMIGLVNHVKEKFPGVRVVLQSVLPMEDRYWYTVGNVLAFNEMLKDVCAKYDCYYLDVFRDFLMFDRRSFNQGLFRDWLHPNRLGCNILSRYYSFITNNNCNKFSMIIDMWDVFPW